MTVAILGSAGQLGRDLLTLRPAIALTRCDIDLSHPDTIRTALEKHRPTVLVNCAAYNLVDKAEVDPTPAMTVNFHGVSELAKQCGAMGIKLVHFSTDYVFGLSGDNAMSPLRESDPPGPLSVYGLSKLAGEYAVRQFCPQHLVLRTCGLYGVWGSGGKGTNFIETMLKLAGMGKALNVVNDQHCTPSYTKDVAEATWTLIDREANGLFHVTNSGATTWHDLAKECFSQTQTSANLSPTTTAAYGAPAARPPYSVLSCDKLAKLGITLRPWPDALRAYLAERRARG
jgi:dTDP-4-dehydrorhamnose reductase